MAKQNQKLGSEEILSRFQELKSLESAELSAKVDELSNDVIKMKEDLDADVQQKDNKIKDQEAELTRLGAENKQLKAESPVHKNTKTFTADSGVKVKFADGIKVVWKGENKISVDDAIKDKDLMESLIAKQSGILVEVKK